MKRYIAVIMLALAVCKSYAAEDVGSGAWCWFADPRALHYTSADSTVDVTWIGYIDTHGNIKAKQYDQKKMVTHDVLVRTCFQPDDHDNPTFLVLPDGRVVVFYSRHTDEPCIYYRISRQAGDITTLGDEQKIITDHNTTYPTPFILSDDPQHIYLCWRGINWHPTIARLTMPGADDKMEIDMGPYQIVQSTGARPYAKYVSDGKSRIYVAYTTGHPDNEMPNNLYCNYIDVPSLRLHDPEGNVLSEIKDGPLQIGKGEDAHGGAMVVDASGYRDWVWQMDLADGAPRIAFTRISGDKHSHNYYLADYDRGKWEKRYIAHGGGHFHQSPDIEWCYSGGMAIDASDRRSVYCSVPVEGAYGRVYEIVKYTFDDNGEVVKMDYITKNSEKNNVRPYIISGSHAPELNLGWLNGDYYDWIVSKERKCGYPTVVKVDSVGDSYTAMPLPSVVKVERFDETTDFVQSYEIDLTKNDAEVLVDLGRLRYVIDSQTMRPSVWYNKKKVPSAKAKGTMVRESVNALATSDSWRDARRATDGKWHPLVPLERFTLTLEYSDGVLRTYINGALDQSITIR